MIANVLSLAFPPNVRRLRRLTRDELGNTLRLDAMRKGLLTIYQQGPPESGIVVLRQWAGGRWQNKLRRFS